MGGSDFVDLPKAKFHEHQQQQQQHQRSLLQEPTSVSSNSSNHDHDLHSHKLHRNSVQVKAILHNILVSLPAQLRASARPLLIKLLSSCAEIDFDEKGQLLVHDEIVPNSNL